MLHRSERYVLALAAVFAAGLGMGKVGRHREPRETPASSAGSDGDAPLDI